MTLKKGLKKLLPILRLGLSLFLIIILLRRYDIGCIYHHIKGTKGEFLVFAVLLNIIGDFLSSLQWKFVLAVHQIKISVRKLFPLYLAGAFFNNFLPTSIGGDIYKIHRLTINNVAIDHALTSVLMTRIMGLWSLLFIATAALYSPLNRAISGGDVISILALLWAIALVSLFTPNFLIRFKFISKLHDILELYRNEKRKLFRAGITSFIAQILGIFFCMSVAASLDIDLSLAQIAYFSSLTIIISALPLAINGLGIREGSYVWLFNKVGIEGEIAMSFSFLIVFLIAIRSIIGGISYALGKDKV